MRKQSVLPVAVVRHGGKWIYRGNDLFDTHAAREGPSETCQGVDDSFPGARRGISRVRAKQGRGQTQVYERRLSRLP